MRAHPEEAQEILWQMMVAQAMLPDEAARNILEAFEQAQMALPAQVEMICCLCMRLQSLADEQWLDCDDDQRTQVALDELSGLGVDCPVERPEQLEMVF